MLAQAGRLELDVSYADGTIQTLVGNDAPFAGYEVPVNSDWVIIRGDGSVADFAGQPDAASVVAYNAAAAQSLQHRYDSGKQFRSALVYWTRD